MACDIRIASERAMFGSFEARRGYHHGDGGIVRLVNACGVGVASHMLLTAEPVDAAAGAAVATRHKVVPHDELMAEAETVARQILRNSQRAVRSAKETILDVIGKTSMRSCAPRPGTPTRARTRTRRSRACSSSTTARTRAARAERSYGRTSPARIWWSKADSSSVSTAAA